MKLLCYNAAGLVATTAMLMLRDPDQQLDVGRQADFLQAQSLTARAPAAEEIVSLATVSGGHRRRRRWRGRSTQTLPGALVADSHDTDSAVLRQPA
jgi:hypothetical protein